MSIIRVLISIGFIFGVESWCGAATWFVRPGVWTTVNATTGHPIPTAGVYGLQNGTDYADAWNGLTSIVWGPGGVSSNDTLYVCGTHIYKIQFMVGAVNAQAVTLIGSSHLTIRMDWPGDPGTLFGGCLNFHGAGAPCAGPDSNGVYNQKLLSTATPPPVFYIQVTNGSTNIIRLEHRNAASWTDKLGGQYLNGTTNYVQLPDGTVPATNDVAIGSEGWAFDLNYQSNITFQSCHFIAMNAQSGGLGAIRHTVPVLPYTAAANNITFTNCTSFDSTEFYLYPGENNFSLLSCEVARTPTAIYGLLNGTVNAPNNITVSNCWIHDIGTPEYNDVDNNAVGIQGGNYHLITRNTFSNTGGAVIMWTGAVNMRSNIVSYNFVLNTMTNSSGSSDAIAIGGLNSSATPGYRIGNQIFGNIIRNCEVVSGDSLSGYGIDLNTPDYTPVYNNTIYGGSCAINWQVVISNCPVNAKIVNNVIVLPSVRYYYIVGSSPPTNLVVDYNLYYPAAALAGTATVYPRCTVDAHSVFSNPVFVSATPAGASDFRLSYNSPAIQAGMALGLLWDFAGMPIPTNVPPDIGAYQFVFSQLVTPTNLHIVP